MDPTRPQTADVINPQASEASNPVSSNNSTGLYSSDMNKYYLDSSLEVKQPGAVASTLVAPDTPRFGGFRALSPRKAVVISAIIALAATALTGGSIILLARHAPDRDHKPQIETQDLSLKDAQSSDLPKELQGVDKSLLVNGDVITRGTLKVASDSFITVIKTAQLTADQTFTLPNGSGTLCLDSNNCNNASLAQLAAANAQLADLQSQLGQLQTFVGGIDVTPTVPGGAGVDALNGQDGTVSIQGSVNRITVNTAGGVITLSTPQDLDANANVQFGSLRTNTITQTGAGNNVSISAGSDALTFTSNGRTFTLPTIGAGSQVICTSAVTCAAGGGEALLLAPGAVQTDTSSNASIFINDTGGGNLIQIQRSSTNRFILNNSGDLTISGNITVQALGNGFVKSSSGALSVVSAIDLASSDVTGILPVTQGGIGVATLAANGVLVGNGTSAVSSVTAGAPGQCLVSNAGAPSFQACPGATGVSSINTLTGSVTLQGTNNQVSVSTGVGTITLSTPQNIHSGASPTFAGLTLSGLGSGVTKVVAGVLSTGNVNLTSEVTGVLPIANGGTGVSTTPTDGKLLIGNSATSGYSLANLTAGAGVNIVNGNGTITISSPSGGTCATCANASLSNLSSVAINTDLLPGSVGVGLGSLTNSFNDLFLDVAAGTGSLRLVASSSTPGNYTVTFPDATGTVCLTTGNCAGVGGAVGGTGTINRLAKFTSTGSQIGDSILTDNGSAVSVSGALSVTGALTGTTVNALSLQANATGFQISGGTSSKTLTVVNDTALNQNLRTTDSPTFASLTLSTALSPANGGTGLNAGPTADGQLLIGSAGGTYTRNTLTAGAGITVTNGAGTIQISSPLAGTCTVGCADQALHNLSGVNINTGLMPDTTQTVNLGSTNRPFQGLHLNSTAGAQGFFITGTNAGSEVTLTLPTLNGTFALVQTAGSSSAQTGDLNVSGSLIGNRVIATLLGSNDAASTGTITLRSGNASGGNSGDVLIDVGTATGTKGSITIGGSNASTLTLGRSGLAVQMPGGLNTQGADIATANGNLNLGTGTITSGLINGQDINGTLATFTGDIWAQGNHLAVGGSVLGTNGALALLDSSDNEIDITTGGGSYTLTLPTTLPISGTECVTLDSGGQLGSQNCTGGIAGTGSTTDNRIPVFTTGGTQLTDSILLQDTSGSGPILGNSFVQIEGSLVIGNADGSAPGLLSFYDAAGTGEQAVITANALAESYALILPDHLDTTGKCLSVGSGGQLGYFACVSGGGGGGTGVTGSGTTDRLLRWTDGTLSTVGDSAIQDTGFGRIGVNVAPDATAVLTVGSGSAFKVTNAGALTVNGIANGGAGITSTGSLGGVTSITATGVIQTSNNGQALIAGGTPTNTATQSLVQVGSTAIVGGNNAANGGTYIGLNAPNSGAGSAADLINLQKNNSSVFKVATNGAVTAGTYNALALQSNATGFQISGGTASRQLTVTANATIDQNLSTTSNVGFNSLTLASALGVTYGGTGIAGGPTADGQLLIGSSGGTYTRATITAGPGVNISNGAGSIQISAPGSGTCSSCADTQLSNLTGTTAIPVNLLPSAAGTINIGSATVPFKDIYIAGSSSTPGTNNFRITGTATAPRTITLPDVSGTVCVAGSCAGLGGGITGSGTDNTLAKFTSGGSAIANSTLSDNGSTVTASGAVSVTGALTAATVNALGLQANATGFQISGGTSSKTLTVVNDVALNQNLRTTDGVTFSSLNLSTALAATYGGTGVDGSSATNGQLLIGNGSGYTLNTLTTDGTVVITNGGGTIQLSAPGLGSCSSCANTALSNLASVSINTSLLTGSSTIDLGSTTQPFRDLYLGGSATNNFKFSGTASGGQKTLTLDNLSGRIVLAQTAGASSAQTGDVHVTNSLISDVDVQTSYLNVTSTSSGATPLIGASNNNASFTGNLLDLKYGNPSPTSKFTVDRNGAVTIAGNVTANGAGPNTFANSVQVSSGTLQAPTVNATTAITLGGANINTAGTLNNVAYLNQTNSFSAANTFSAVGTALSVTNNASIGGTATIGTLSVTSNGTISGGTLTVGTSSSVAGSVVLYDGGSGVSANTATVNVTAGLGQNTAYTLPDPGVSSAEVCVKYSGTSTNCTGIGGGLSVSGTPSAGQVAVFSSASAVAGSSVLTISGNNVILGQGNDRNFNIAQASSGVGYVLTIQAGQGATTGNQTGGNLLLQSGAGGGSGNQGSVIVRANGTDTQQAFVIQAYNGGSFANLFTADTTSNRRILIGTGTPSLSTTSGSGNLYVTNTVEIASRLLIGTASDGVDVNLGAAAGSRFRINGTARNTKTITMTPEFNGVVLVSDNTGNNSTGYMLSDHDATQRENYYVWSTNEASVQDYDMVIQIPLPSDFGGFANSTPITIDRWTSDTSNGVITAQLKDTAGANAANWNTCSITPGSASTWTTTANCTVAGGTFVADGIMTLRLHLVAAASGGTTRIGNIKISYLSNF